MKTRSPSRSEEPLLLETLVDDEEDSHFGGQQFSVTRERIRRIEAKALRKLKHPSRSRKLRSFLDNQEALPSGLTRAQGFADH